MSETKTVDLEFNELAKMVASKKEVTVILQNGYQIRCVIEDYDSNVILVRSGQKANMVYRQVISTIVLNEGK